MEEAFDSSPEIDKAALKALSKRSDALGLAQLGGHAVALVGTGGLIAWAGTTLWLVPALVLHGFVLIFLFAPLHETIHRTAFRSRRLNDAVAWLCGLVLVLPPGFFRAFHFAHHRYTQDPARDPELITPKPQTPGAYWWRISGLPYWQERVSTLLRHARGQVTQDFIPPRERAAVVREARVYLGAYAGIAVLSLLFASPAALLYGVLPALLGQPFLRAYLLAEHTGCPLIADMLRNSRTTRSNLAMRRLAWNMPYHAEHHAYPAVPFHALPQAHELLRDRIAVQASGYVAVQLELLRAMRQPATAVAEN